MTVLTATKHGAIDDTTRDLHLNAAHVRPLVEACTLVSLTCSEEVASHRVFGNLIQCTRHAKRTTTHLHLTFTLNDFTVTIGFHTCSVTHIGQLATAIDAR